MRFRKLLGSCVDLTEDIVRVFHARPLAFSLIAGIVFILFFGLGLLFGLIPDLDQEPADETSSFSGTGTVNHVVTRTRDVVGDEPVRIIIDAIGVDASIETPTSDDINVLDEALLRGVVHYPGSGDLEDTSNMFLFGHSTGFRVVQNQAFKAFNNLNDLVKGDLIRVRSEDKEYLYKVQSVTLVNADNAFVELTNKKKMLTLSTCNTFGQKQDRYVVEATYLSSYIFTE